LQPLSGGRKPDVGFREGTGPLGSTTAGTIGALLANPIVAAVLGVALGVGMLLVSRATARTVTPEDASLGMVRVGVAMVLRLLVALGALLCFYVWIRPGLVPFGIGLVAGFLVTIAVELFRLGGRSAPSAR
jgi:hypothetical protein